MKRSILLLALLPLSGCVVLPSTTKSAFTGRIERDFSAEMLKMPLFTETTATPELRAKYAADWQKILDTIVDYEDELEK